MRPSGLHNNSDCADKGAAPAGDQADEADTATARRTVLIEKINMAGILRMNSEPARIFALWQAKATVARSIYLP
jgi:hypothetical protein